MTEDTIENIASLAQKSLLKFSIERDVAQYIKTNLDTQYGNNWHCIVGK